MTANGPRRPISARDFNRLLFALLLLGGLTVMARLITHQETQAHAGRDMITQAQWERSGDALFLRGQWDMAADAYFGAMERALENGRLDDPRLHKKLALSLYRQGDIRSGIHFLRMYRAMLLHMSKDQIVTGLKVGDELHDPSMRASELTRVEDTLGVWSASN